MGDRITSGLTIGLDLGDRWTEGRVLDAAGAVIEAFRVRTTEPAMTERLASFPPSRVVLEVGTHSPWVSRCVVRHGHEAIVANPRRVRLIAENDSKSDGVDAELLARLGRMDPSLLKPIVHRGAQAQRDRILIQTRDGLVRARTQLVNQVRGFAKALGTRVPASSTEAFPKRVRATTPMDLFPGLETLLDTIEQLTATIRQMDREVEQLCRERYPETELLRQVPGVGPITALYYVLTIEDPRRFATSRADRSVRRASSEATRFGGTESPATDHEGRGSTVAASVGECCALHPRALWSRHGSATCGPSHGGARREHRPQARDRRGGETARRPLAPSVDDGRGLRARASRFRAGCVEP